MNRLTITTPDDYHIHLRDNDQLKTTVTHCARQFNRAIVMPNLTNPIINTQLATDYLERITQQMPVKHQFKPLMTLYLTDKTTADDIKEAKHSGIIFGCKLYPKGATTLSDKGASSLEQLKPIFEVMEQLDLPLLIHGEVTDPTVDIFDRETVFIDRYLTKWVMQFPRLRIVLEHITTKYAVDFISQQSNHVAATITPHHMLINRNDLLVGGIKPHYYCLPIVKKSSDQQALIKAATSQSPHFFLGTDSAPHSIANKHNDCGCAGIYTAHAAMPLIVELFENHDALDKVEAFTSHFGAEFYQLPINSTKMTLEKLDWLVPSTYPFGTESLRPFAANQTLKWKITEKE